MGAESIWKLGLGGTPNVRAVPGLCKRLRFRRSDCQRCVEICPEDAISLKPGPSIGDRCSDCGLCRRVCPTDAFRNEVESDESLLNRAASLRQMGRVPGERQRLSVHCHRVESGNGTGLEVPCLGSLSEHIIVGAARLGFAELRLVRGACSGCRLRRGAALVEGTVKRARGLLESIGVGRVSITLGNGGAEPGAEPARSVTRREMFSAIASRMRSGAGTLLDRGERVIRERLTGRGVDGEGVGPSPRRRLLGVLLERTGQTDGRVLRYEPGGPWGRVRIDARTCSACGICGALCPTGAITRQEEDGYEVLSFNAASCTNCRLCAEACPQGAIDFAERCPVSELLEDEARVAARVRLTSCLGCGETIRAGGTGRCPTCEKRQVGPMPVRA